MEDTLIPDLETGDVIINDVVSSQNDDDRSSGPENDYERRGAVGVDSEKSTGGESEEMHRPLEMEKGAEKVLEVNRSVATNDVALSQSDELLINQTGVVGIDSNKSTVEEITEMLKLLKVEEDSGENLEVNISDVANDVALSQSDDLLIAVSSSSTLVDGRSSGPRNGFELRGAVEIDSDISSGEETKETNVLLEMEASAEKDLEVNGSGAATGATLIGDDIKETSSGKDYEMEESAEKDLEVNGSGAANSVTLSQVNDLLINQEKDLEVNGSGAATGATLSQVNDFLINQVEAVGTESDTSIGDDIKETSPGKDYEMEKSAEKDLEVNGSGAANSVTLSQVNDLLINQEKDLEVNGSGAATGATLSQVNDFLINQVEAVGTESDTSIGDDIKETSPGKDYEMEESAEKDLEVNGSGAANSVTLSQVNDLLINQVGAVGTEADTSVAEDIEETSAGKDYEMEESAEKDLEVNGSGAANSVTLSQVNDLLINQVGAAGTEFDTSIGEDIEEMSAGNDYEMEESAEKDLEVNGSGAANSVTLSQVNDLLLNQVGAAGTESDTSIGEDIEEMSAGNDYEMEESAEKDLDVNGSGVASSATLSQVNDLLINQVGAVGAESDTSIVDDIKETSPRKDYEMEKNAEKDLEVNGSGAASSATLSQVNDLLISQAGAVGTESDTSIGDDIKETSPGKDYEVNISVAANDVAISCSVDIVINHIGAVGIEFNKTTDAEIKEMPKLLAMEESSGNDLETNISVANNDVALSQSDDLLIAVSSPSSTIFKDQSSDEYITQPELLEMEESAGKHPEMNRSSAANNVPLSLGDDLLINQIGADGIDSNKSTIEEIKEKPKLIEVDSFGNDLEANISVADNDVTSSTSSDLLITVSSLSTLSDDQSSGEDLKEHELLNMEENAGNDLKVNTLTAANDVALSQSTDLLNHSGVVGTDFNRSACEVIKVMPKLPELEEGAVKDPETNISVANNDVALCQGDDLMITVSSSSTLSDNQSSGEDTKKMPIVLETEDNAGKDLEMHQLEAVNNAGLSQSQDVLITISSFPSTLSDQQSSGHGNETSSELIGAVEIDADKPGSEETLEMPKLLVTPEPEKSGKNVKFNLRKSLAWDSAFFTSDGVLDADELSTMMEGGVKNARHQLPGIEEEVYRSMDSISTLESDNLSLECLEAELFEDIRASIQKSNRSSSNLNNSSIKVSAGKKDSQAKVISWPRNGFELRGAVEIDSDISSGEETKETNVLLEMEASAEKDLEVNGSGAATGATLSQVNDFLINQVEAVGTESDTSIGDDIKETSPGKDYEMEKSAEKDLEVNGSGVASSATLSQVNDLLINQVGAVGTESDTSIVDDIKETSPGKDYEMEKNAEKDLEVNGSGAASSATLSQVNDLLISQAGAVGTESDTSIGDDIKEMSPGKDYDVNISVAANDVAISCSDDIVINHIGAVGIEFNKTTDAEIKEMPKLLSMEESSGNDLETNISVANNDVALSQSDDLLIAVSSPSSKIFKDQSSDEYITQPELLEMEESAWKHPEMNRSSAANNVPLSLGDDLLINQIGADGIDSNKSTIEEIKEKPKLIEVDSFGNDLEANISVADNDVTSSTSSELLITVSLLSTLSDDQSSGEDIKEHELLNMEENAGNDLKVNTLTAANDVALSQSTDLLNHSGVVGTDFNRSACEVIKVIPKLPELEEGAVKDPETNISVANNDVALCQGDDLMITVSSSSTLSDNQSSGEDTKKMPIVLETEDNAGKDLEMHQLGAVNNAVLSQSQDVLITISSFPSTLSDQQSSGHGNETSSELIGAVEIDADKPGSEETLEMPKLLVTPEPEKSGKNVKFNLRKSLAWDNAFFTSDGVLDADELSTMMEGGVKNARHQLPGIEEEVYRSMDSISTLESDNLSLECLEAELFEDIRASIQKSNRSSSNLNNSSIKVSSGKKDSQAKVISSSKKVDTDSGKRPAARMKHTTSSIPQPKIVSRVNSSSTLTLTKRASLSANHAKKDQDIARQPHVIQKGTQAARATTQGSPIGSSTALKTEPTRPSSSHSNSSSCSSGTDVKSSTTLSRKKIDSKSSKLTTTAVPKTPSRVIMKNKPQPPANSRVSSHSVLSTVSSSISPASSISEWSSESSSSTTNNNRRSESRGSTDTIVSYRSLDNDASGQSASNIPPTGRISNQNGNQPISQSGSLARPPCVQPTGLKMPSPKIGFFDGGKSGAQTPNGGNTRPQSKLPTGIPKIGATHSNPIISNGVKSGKIPPPKTSAAHTIMKPNPQKAAPKPSQPTGLRMPSPKIGFFDGGKSGARTPNGGNIRPQSKLPTGIPKIGATHSNPIISNGVKSGKIPPPKISAAHTIMKPNPQKAAPKPSQEQPKTKSSLVTSDASNTVTDGSRTPFAVKNSEAY